jgi:hypothetical protein
MENDKIEKNLNQVEEAELREGQNLYEMTQTAGFGVLKLWLEDLAFHSWVDPREVDKPGGLSKDEWMWRELNAFYAANNARELLEKIQKSINNSEYLSKKKSGEIQGARPMKI